MADSIRPAAKAGLLRRLDPRLKIVLLLAGCFLIQGASSAGLVAALAVLAAAFFLKDVRTPSALVMARGGFYFSLFWFAMKLVSDILMGTPWRDSFAVSLPMAGKLMAFALLGAAFAGLSSPLEIGKAVSWFLRPFLGKRAWKPAMAVSLVSWFLPNTLRLHSQIRDAMRARGLKPGWRKTASLLVGASLRMLEKKAQDLSVGMASRHLDDDNAWRLS